MGFCNIGAGRCNLHHQLTCPEIGCLKNNYNGHNKTGHYGVFNQGVGYRVHWQKSMA